MSMAISAILTISALLATAVTLTGAFLNSSAAQAAAVREAWNMEEKQLDTAFAITSASAEDSGEGTRVTLMVSNTGNRGFGTFSNMDVLVVYTTSLGDQEIKRLPYVTATPSSNEWTVSAVSPGTFHPNMWDPDETATITLQVVPPAEAETLGTVVVVGPTGVSDSAYFGG